MVKGKVFFLCKGAVDIVIAASAVSCGEKCLAHINGFKGDDRSGGIKKAEPFSAEPADIFRKLSRCERTAGDYAVSVGNGLRFLGYKGNVRVGEYFFGNAVGKFFSVNGKCPSCRNGIFLGAGDCKGAETAHFFL